MVAEQHDLLLEPSYVRVAPGTVQVEAPFEHRARDVERTGNDAVPLSVGVGANVQDQRSAPGGRKCSLRLQPFDARSSVVEQLFDPGAFRASRHSGIMPGLSSGMLNDFFRAADRS